MSTIQEQMMMASMATMSEMTMWKAPSSGRYASSRGKVGANRPKKKKTFGKNKKK